MENNDAAIKAINTRLADENTTDDQKLGLLQAKIELMESGTGSGSGTGGQGDGFEGKSSHDLITAGLKELKGGQ